MSTLTIRDLHVSVTEGDGNLRETVDFRAVYASLVEQWFHVDAERILPDAKKMPRFSLIA